MNKIIPWDRWIAMITPYYPSGKRGRPTRGIETMLRMYLLQIWFAQRIAESDNEQLKSMALRIAKRPSSLKTTDVFKGFNWDKFIEHQKSSIRCKVEHAFLIVKRDFGYRKVAYKGLKKNLNRFHMLFACANLLMLIRGGRTEQFCTA